MKEQVTNEQLTFDNAAYAQSVKEQEEEFLKKAQKALIIAGVASVLGAFLLITEARSSAILGIIALFGCPILAIISYAIGGGVGAAFKTWFALVKWAWLLVIFPLDLLTGAFALVGGLIGILYLPIIFVYYSYNKHKKNLEAAEEYLKFCK